MPFVFPVILLPNEVITLRNVVDAVELLVLFVFVIAVLPVALRNIVDGATLLENVHDPASVIPLPLPRMGFT